ncbi:MAG TPA: hypothetical protein VK449_05235, partial [Anaerolineales bacterium]|nr:hypothetical protein [Anaerolineales bacterium]
MATLEEAITSLSSAVGQARTSEILRRLLLVPGALDWLREEAVTAALASASPEDASPATVALLAATGHAHLSDIV